MVPVVEEGAAIAAEAESGDAAEGSGTVLLVDDEAAVRASTADMLIDLGYQVVESASAEEAMGRVTHGLSPDIVITDHLMPGMTGADLARWIHGINPSVPVLLISGYADVEDLAPDLPRLPKPFRQTDLAAALGQLATPPQRAAS